MSQTFQFVTKLSFALIVYIYISNAYLLYLPILALIYDTFQTPLRLLCLHSSNIINHTM